MPYFRYDVHTGHVLNLQTGHFISPAYALRIAKVYKKYKGHIPKEFATGHKKRLYAKAHKRMLKGEEELTVSLLKPEHRYAKRQVQTTTAELPYGKKYKLSITKVRTRKWGKRLWREEGTIKGFIFYEEKKIPPQVKSFYQKEIPLEKPVEKPPLVGLIKGGEIYLHRLNKARDKAFNILVIPLNITYQSGGYYGNGWSNYLYKKKTLIVPQLHAFLARFGNEMSGWTTYFRLHGMVYSENYGDYPVHISSPYQVPLNNQALNYLLQELDAAVQKLLGKSAGYEYVEITHVTFFFNTSGLTLTEEQRHYTKVGVHGF